MSRAITAWLDDEAEQALDLLQSTGLAEAEAIRLALVEAAVKTGGPTLVTDPNMLEQALDKSHQLAAEIIATQRPPR